MSLSAPGLVLPDRRRELLVDVSRPENANEQADEAAVCANDGEDPPDDCETCNSVWRAAVPEHPPGGAEQPLVVENVACQIRPARATCNGVAVRQ